MTQNNLFELLQDIGFAPSEECDGRYECTTSANELVRVVIGDNDIQIFKFSAEGFMIWKCEFSEMTPDLIVSSTIKTATCKHCEGESK